MYQVWSTGALAHGHQGSGAAPLRLRANEVPLARAFSRRRPEGQEVQVNSSFVHSDTGHNAPTGVVWAADCFLSHR
jgi:hypothetical protein